MSDDKFEFINDEEIEAILGKQDDDVDEKDTILSAMDELISGDAQKSDNHKSDGLLDELLSYKKEEKHDDNDEREEIAISPVHFREFTDDEEIDIDLAGLQMLYDVPVDISVLLGSVSVEIGKLSKIGVGSKIPLKKLAGEPVEIYVGEILIAKGITIVVDNENTFGVMITEILSERERILSVYESFKRQKQI